MILDDADRPAVEGGVYHIGYIELVDGYRHAYEVTSTHGYRKWVRYSRTANHPPDPRCPECADHRKPTPDPTTEEHPA